MTFASQSELEDAFRRLALAQGPQPGKGQLYNAGYEDHEHLLIASAHAARMQDRAGNTYIDVSMGGGSLIFGHAYAPIVDRIKLQADAGTVYIAPSVHAYTLKNLVLETLPEVYTGAVFCNSGSEATMRAIRMARAATGKSGIALFGGGWHGGHDGVLVGEDPSSPETEPSIKALSTGLPDDLLNEILMLPYNKEQAFDLIKREAHRLALVLVEPVQGSNPQPDCAAFLRSLANVCRAKKVLLGFDEIITGFRLGLGGGVERFDVVPDVITYGKILGGGLPVGAVVFTESMATRVFGATAEPFFTGGTYSANPLTMSVGIGVLQNLMISDYTFIDNLSENLRQNCNRFFKENAFPLQVIGCGSINRILFTDQKIANRRERDRQELGPEIQKLFRKLMILNGIQYPTNGILFLSFAHTAHDVEEIVAAIKKSAEDLNSLGWFDKARI